MKDECFCKFILGSKHDFKILLIRPILCGNWKDSEKCRGDNVYPIVSLHENSRW
jgi:hypothetical protein